MSKLAADRHQPWGQLETPNIASCWDWSIKRLCQVWRPVHPGSPVADASVWWKLELVMALQLSSMVQRGRSKETFCEKVYQTAQRRGAAPDGQIPPQCAGPGTLSGYRGLNLLPMMTANMHLRLLSPMAATAASQTTRRGAPQAGYKPARLWRQRGGIGLLRGFCAADLLP